MSPPLLHDVLPLSDVSSPTKTALTPNQQKNRARNRTKTPKAVNTLPNCGTNVQAHRKTPDTPARQVRSGPVPAIAKGVPYPKKQEILKRGMEEKNIDEEPPKKTRLEALEEKTKELQGYLNTLQDAVTIGMNQLRDLKERIATATTDFESVDE
ncbi:hypothetical protein F4678DRAFT_460359 [Xylaria arbuscula]|nr:hypothetical protein F4678DRAFT_460359 [Xylaria arbuscula]